MPCATSNAATARFCTALCYARDSLRVTMQRRFDEGDVYFDSPARQWITGTRQVFRELPARQW